MQLPAPAVVSATTHPTVRRLLGIFAKWPQPGQVKTRLARDVGAEYAARLAEAFLRDTVERFAGLADERWLCYAPSESAAWVWFQGIAQNRYTLWPQPPGDLGQRLEAFFAAASQSGANRLVVVGADSPTLPTEFVAEAFRKLESHPAVLGPTDDGGYYLLGVRTVLTGVLTNIRWSTPHALQDTQGALVRAGLPPDFLPVWYDVDTLADLHRLRTDCETGGQHPATLAASWTTQLLGLSCGEDAHPLPPLESETTLR